MIFNEKFYENNQIPNQLLHIRQMGIMLKDPRYSIQRSESLTYLIGYVQSGELILDYNNKRYTISNGMSIIMPANINYKISSSTINPPVFMWINIRGDFIKCNYDLIFNQPFVVSNADIQSNYNIIKQTISQTFIDNTVIFKGIFNLLLDIYKQKIDDIYNFYDKENLQLKYEHYMSNIIQNEQSLYLPQMAKDFKCSTDTLNRNFKKLFECTPLSYYQKMRIEIACSLLCNTSLTIEQISNKLCYSNRNYFSMYFNKTVGKYPGQYRKEKMIK